MSESAKHTPGPWAIEDGGIVEASGAPVCVLYTADDFPCWDGPEGQLEAECEANAALIAAAPDLLALCEAMVAAVDGSHAQVMATVARMKVLIAKVKGGAS